MDNLMSGEAHAWACAQYGDCLFDSGQGFVKKLESNWEIQTRHWKRYLYKSLGGVLGFGQELSSDYLYFTLFQPERFWPEGLTSEEKKLLRLARAISAYHPAPDGLKLRRNPGPPPSDMASVTRSLKRYASLFRENIALPMWSAYENVKREAGLELQGLCSEAYAEPCSAQEASDMWAGDLERGFKLQTLEATPATYEVLKYFLNWIST